MGLRLVVAVLAAVVLAAPAQAGIREGAVYLRGQQNADGGFGEPGKASFVNLSAWVVIGLRATGRWPERRDAAADYLSGRDDPRVTDLALRLLALDSMDRGVATLAERLEDKRASNGRIGGSVNSTIWAILALRAAGQPAGLTSVRYLIRQQRPNGGWPWYPGGAPDSNDTAAAIQALRAAGRPAGSRPIQRGLRYLRRLQNANGGFELTADRGSDAQSTAWAIQALLAAGERPGLPAFRYLKRLQRANGSYRYSGTHGVTPVWVTAQVLPALARKPFPLR
jgi:prenyltransferase beta subunit